MQRLAEIEVPADELAAARAGDRDARRALFERVAPATLGIIRRLVVTGNWPRTCCRTR